MIMNLEQQILASLANFETSNYRTLLEKAAKELHHAELEIRLARAQLEELRSDFGDYAHHVGICNGAHKNYECCCGLEKAKERWCV